MATKSLSAVTRFSQRLAKNKIVAFLRKQSPLNIAFMGAIIVLSAYAFMFIIAAFSNALLFDGYPADGAAQLLNPLRRMAAGEAIGSDFNTFHGIAMPLLHLPFYYLFGQGLFASELARWILSPVIFMGGTFIFFYAFERSKKIAFIATTVITAIATTIMPWFVAPFTSMLGVRAAAPVLLAVLMFKQERFNKPFIKRFKWLSWWTQYEVLAAVTMVVCLVCGTEFGVAAIIGFLLVHFFFPAKAKTPWLSRIFSTLRIIAAFVIAVFVIFGTITGGDPLPALKYAFVTIPFDQFWYFGVPPNTFLHFENIVQQLTADTTLHLYWGLALVAAIITFITYRLRAYRQQSRVFTYALFAGIFAMISMIGYYYNSEAYALARMALLVIGAGGILLVTHYASRARFTTTLATGKKKYTFGLRNVAIVLAMIFVGMAITHAYSIVVKTKGDYDLIKVARKTKAYLAGTDTNVLADTWNRDDSALMPIVQQDNYMAIVDENNGDILHGINIKTHEVIVDPAGHNSFLRNGQIVYFSKSGRQIVASAKPYGDKYMAVKVQNSGVEFSPERDGAPNKMIIAEDFNHDNTKLWSTYTTVFEMEMGIFNPNSQHADYIIHALGPELRKKYVDDFERVQPKYVMTLSKAYFMYEEWLQNASWDFYSQLDANYEAIKDGTMHTVWKRRDQPWVKPLETGDTKQKWQSLKIEQDGKKIPMPEIYFSILPYVNKYLNDNARRDAEKSKADGLGGEPLIYLSREEFARNQGQRDLNDALNAQRLVEGQGHFTTVDPRTRVDSAAPGNPVAGGTLERPRRAVVLVKLRYETTNPLQKVPLLGGAVRYLVQTNNLFSRTQVSLPPYQNELIFPLVISERNQDAFLSLATYSLLPAKPGLKITSAEWQLLDTSVANLRALTDAPGPDILLP